MAKRLEGRVAIVTGGARGIGRAHCLLLAEEGAKIVVNDFGGEIDGTGSAKGPADEVVAEIKKIGGEAVACYDDVAEPKGGENIIKTALDSFGGLHILINNAGILRDRMVFNMSEEEWDRVLKVHLYGHFWTTKNACVHFRQMWKENKQGGRIIMTSSEAGLGNMGQANYSAAKEGIIGLTRTIARDMGRYGVTCNAIRPRAATRLTLTPELKAAIEKRQATGIGAGVGVPGLSMDLSAMMAEPEAISPFVVFLCTDEAADINGRNFAVGGGSVSLYSEPEIIKTISKDGRWTLDELIKLVPGTLASGLVNPSPPGA